MLNTCNPVMLFVYEEIQTNIDVSAIQVIDYVKDSYMRIQKIPIYLYDKSIVTIEFANNTINILIPMD